MVSGSPPAVTHFEAVTQPPEAASGAGEGVGFRNDAWQRMTVPVRLSGAGPFHFLVDTGSDRTSVSRELAGRVGLREAAGATLHSATGASAVRMVRVPELLLSRRAVRQIDAPMLDAADMGADGILGIDSLRAHRVLFDFAARTLSITSSQAPVGRDEKDAIVVRARRREGRLVITDAEAGGARVDVVLDTGSQYSVGNAALRRLPERRGEVQSEGPLDLVSVTGAKLRGELAFVRRLDIGGARLENLAVVFADAHTFRLLKLESRPALLLGMSGLRSFDKVSIDFESRKLRLVVPRPGTRRPGA